MALLLKDQDNSYFKIDMNGDYIIFKNKTARNTNKKVTDYNIVLAKYVEIIDSIYSPERNYYDYANMAAEIRAWAAEHCQYINDVEHGEVGHTYPLMEQYIPDVNKTIPKIIRKGHTGIFVGKAKNLKEMYTMIKESKIFGECEDA